MTAFLVKSLQNVTRFIKKRLGGGGGGGRNLSAKLRFLLMPDTLIPVQTPLSRQPQPASPSPQQAAGGACHPRGAQPKMEKIWLAMGPGGDSRPSHPATVPGQQAES